MLNQTVGPQRGGMVQVSLFKHLIIICFKSWNFDCLNVFPTQASVLDVVETKINPLKLLLINISSGNFCLQGRSVCQLKNATWVHLTLALKLQKLVVKFIYLYFNTRSLPCNQKATAIPQTVRLYTWTPLMVIQIYHKRLGSPWLQCEKKSSRNGFSNSPISQMSNHLMNNRSNSHYCKISRRFLNF